MINSITQFFYSCVRKLDINTVSVVKKSLASLLVKVGSMVLLVLVSVFLGRMLGAEGLGILTLSHKIITVLIIVGLLGMRQVIIKEIAIAHNKQDYTHIGNVMYSAYLLNGLVTLVLSIIFIFISPWLAGEVFHEPKLTYPLVVALLAMTPQVLSRVFSSALVGYNKIWQSNLVDQALSIAITGVLLWWYWLINDVISLNLVAVLYAVGRVVVTLIVGVYWRYLYRAPKGRQIIVKNLLPTAIPLFWVTIATAIITNANVVILGWLAGAKEVGLFVVAARLALLTSFFLQITNAAVSPKLAALYEEQKIKEMSKMVQNITAGLIMVGVVQVLFIGFAGDFLLSLWGLEFKEAFWILMILSLGQLVNIGTGPVDTLLVMCGYEKTQRNISVLFMGFNIALNLLLIPFYGALGAAIATALTVIGQNISRLILAKNKIGISTIILF